MNNESQRRIVNQHRIGVVSRFMLGIYEGDLSTYGLKSSLGNEDLDYLSTNNNDESQRKINRKPMNVIMINVE
jgi:hypothetical protein